MGSSVQGRSSVIAQLHKPRTVHQTDLWRLNKPNKPCLAWFQCGPPNYLKPGAARAEEEGFGKGRKAEPNAASLLRKKVTSQVERDLHSEM